MQRLRSLHHKQRYTQLANDAIDNLPTLESVGLLATILRHSDHFDFQMSVLIKSKPGLGEKKAYQARTTLIEYGYLVQVRFKHTYRGRMCTDIYRSPEPHSAEDLALLCERYALGNDTTITDDDGRERQVTIVWTEITSAEGVEVLAHPVDNSSGDKPPQEEEETNSQVAPDPDLAGPGTAGPGTAGPAKSGSNKEDCSVEDEKEDHQQHAGGVGGDGDPLTNTNQDESGEGDPVGDEGEDDAEAQARQLIVNLRPTRDPASRVQPHRGVVQPVARALRADVPEEAVREYLVEGSETARQPAAIVVTRARNIDDLIQIREEAARRKAQREGQDQGEPSSDSGLPDWCGECDEVDRVRDDWRWQEGIRGNPGSWVLKPVLCGCHPTKRRRQAGETESTPA